MQIESADLFQRLRESLNRHLGKHVICFVLNEADWNETKGFEIGHPTNRTIHPDEPKSYNGHPVFKGLTEQSYLLVDCKAGAVMWPLV